jgi:hypothetical protein
MNYKNKFISIFCFLICLSLAAKTQIRTSYVYDKNSKITDSSGTVIPYLEWQGLMSTGDYMIKRKINAPGDTALVLGRLTYREQQRMASFFEPMKCPFLYNGESINFGATDIHGNYFDMSNLGGKVVVMWFWFMDDISGYSFPPFNRLVDTFANNSNVVFLSFCLDSQQSLNSLLKNNPIKFNLFTDSKPTADLLDIKTFPVFMIVDQTGKLRYQSCAMHTSIFFWLKTSIRELLE